MKKLEELRDYYDNHDTSEELAKALEDGTAAWETDTVDDPMITTSLRLPRSKLAEIRALAAAEGMKPTAMMRKLIDLGIANLDQGRGRHLQEVDRSFQDWSSSFQEFILAVPRLKAFTEQLPRLEGLMSALMEIESSQPAPTPRKAVAKQASPKPAKTKFSNPGARKATGQPRKRSQPPLSPPAARTAKPKGNTSNRKG